MPKPVRQKIEGTMYRSAEISVRAADDASSDERLIDLSFSSEEPVLRNSWFDDPWIEILSHDEGDVDLSRLQNGAPLLYNHRTGNDTRLGVVENAEVSDSRGHATVRMSSRSELMDQFWKDIQDGILRNISVGYQIIERVLLKENANGPDEYRCRWMPYEVSIVDIPADASVGIGRSHNYEVINLEGGIDMPKEVDNTTVEDGERAAAPATPAVKTVSDPATPVGESTRTIDADAVRAEAIKGEQTRRTEIREAFSGFAVDTEARDLMDTCLDDPAITPAEANTRLLKLLGSEGAPSARVEGGVDERDKLRSAASEALDLRAGFIKHDEVKHGGSELRGYTMSELARFMLERSGVKASGLSRMEMVGRAITHSTSDFAYILGNVANKSLLKGYLEVPELFERIARVGNLSDFKTADRVNISAFSDLEEVGENGEYKSGTVSDSREQIQLATYGKKFSISRQAIINDDLSAMTRVPMGMGQAAKRKVGDLVWAVLTANAAMADGVALFHANHANLAASGAAPSVTTLSAAKAAMAKQTDPSGNATIRMPASLAIVPVALEDAMKTLIASATDPSQANSRKPNIHQGTLEVVSDARLDVDSAVKWYLASNPDIFDTIEVAYLDGNPNPFLESKDGWDVDGIEYKVRIDAAAKALDHRGLYQNPGV